MRINVRKIIDMWNKKNYSSDERSKDFRAILKYYDRIINYTDLGILTINIHKTVFVECEDMREVFENGEWMEDEKYGKVRYYVERIEEISK